METVQNQSSGVWYWDVVDESSGEQTFYTFSWNAALPSRLAYQLSQDGQYIRYAWRTDGSGATVLSSITDSQGRTITPSYDSQNLLSGFSDSAGPGVGFQRNSANEVTAITNTAGQQTVLGYNGSGELTQITDPDGNVTTLTYDGSGRVSRITRVTNLSAGTGPTYQFPYSPSVEAACGAGSASAAVPQFEESTLTTPNGAQWRYCVDAQDRVLTAINPAGTVTTSSYNAVGAPTGGATYAAGTPVPYSSQTPLLSSATSYQTLFGEPTSTPRSASVGGRSLGSASYTVPSGQTQPLENGALAPTGTTDSQNNPTSYGYDQHGNVTQITDALASAPAPYTNANSNLRFGYAFGNWPGLLMTASEQQDGSTTFYGYDAQGNLTALARQSSSVAESFAYDALGRLVSQTDENGNVAAYSYNNLDEVTHASFTNPGAGAGQTDVWYAYDNDGNLTSESDPSGTQGLAYNSLGQLTSVTFLAGGGTVSYTYDADGNLKTLTNANGTYTYSYNSLAELTGLTQADGRQTTFAYDQLGCRTEASLPNGDTISYGYDSVGHETGLTVTNSAGTVLLSRGYSYRTVSGQLSGLVQQQTDNAGDVTSYTYGPLNRLVQAQTTGPDPSDYQYTYDGDGNLTEVVYNGSPIESATYDPQTDRQLTVDSTYQNSFDADGNVTNLFGEVPVSYNTRDQTTSLYNEPYSFFGQEQNDLTTCGNDHVTNNQLGINSITAFGQTSCPFYDTAGSPVGEQTPGGDYYLVSDPNGSVLAELDSGGQIARSNTYDPYGTQRTSGSGPDDIGFDGSLTYPGWDVDHFGARLYVTTTGQWLQPDPAERSLITDPTQADPYQFAADDPVNMTDPNGQSDIGGVGDGTSICNIAVASRSAAIMCKARGACLASWKCRSRIGGNLSAPLNALSSVVGKLYNALSGCAEGVAAGGTTALRFAPEGAELTFTVGAVAGCVVSGTTSVFLPYSAPWDGALPQFRY